jgi:hemerythrin-like domain-containing protein
MKKAIEELMHEHRVIEQVLGSLETFAAAVKKGSAVDRATVKDYATFFGEFADRCHHGKEEARLFVKMMEHGFPRDQGPLAVMYSDHEQGRRHVAALAAIARLTGPLTHEERDQIVHHAMTYAPYLRAHIAKEDRVLYPMALQAIPEAEMDQLAADFESFEHDVMGPGVHEGLHAMVAKLLQDYPVGGGSAVHEH